MDATIRVRVPEDAKVWVDGKLTQSTGSYRVFRLAGVSPDTETPYNVRATIPGEGRVTRLETVKVRGGEFREITFSRLDFKLQ